jgi:hypothetical protein
MPRPKSAGLKTMVDVELEGIQRTQLEQAVAGDLARRGPGLPGTVVDKPKPEELTVLWRWLQKRHGTWAGAYWAECRALYAGGPRLLEDKDVMARLFPRHMEEESSVYDERRKRAHYFPYPGSIIDHLLAGLGTDPLRVTFGDVDKDGDAPPEAESDWWQRFVADVTAESEEEGDDDEIDEEAGCSMSQFCVEVIREAMQAGGSCWILCDLPRLEEDDIEPDSALDVPEVDPYLCVVPAEQVVDWAVDDHGKLIWALILVERDVRASLSEDTVKRCVYTLWTRTDWVRYIVELTPNKPMPLDMPIPPSDYGEHDFGKVPLEHFVLPEGLRAMDKLHSLAKEHFNKRCATAWAEYKSLFPVFYEFLAPEDKGGLPVAEAQTDPDRAIRDVRGQGYTLVRGSEDRAEYVGPPPEVFKEGRESCNDIMREMHRVMHSMALSVDEGSAAIRRSGESKEQDGLVIKTILNALGKLIRKLVRKLLALVSIARGKPVPEKRVAGLENFDVTGIADRIAQAVELFAGVPIKSPTFAQLYLADLYLAALGQNATDEQRAKVTEEVRTSVTGEDLLAAGGMMTNVAPPIPPGGGDEDEGEDIGEEDDEPPAPKPKAKAAAGGTRRMIGSM